jgi:signal transduction histidine kinase
VEESAAAEATGDQTADILVVDDDERNARAIEAVLRDVDVRPTFAPSGDDALRRLLQHDYAVILLDVRMPGMDGFETARFIRMRARTRHVPIIFMTAYGHDEADIRRAYELGAVDYLFKPIIPEILRAKVLVFVELRNRNAELAEKADQLRAVERLEGLRLLEEERRKWEAEVLRRQIDEQRALNEQLAEVDRRKDAFIALLAHELRNPLTPIAMGLELMRLQRTADPVLASTRDAMERQVAHLTRLVDDLLDVARITQGKLDLRLETLDIGEIVEAAVDTCRPAFEQAQHEVVVQGPRHIIAVRADPVRMTQVVANLVNNATRYSEPGGHITVRWGVETGRAFVSVTDRGRGIEPEFLSRVFDSFAQERDGGRGLGLGLTLVRELVELHGGTVEARSDGRGKGSTFTVRLQLAEDPVEERERTPRPRRPRASRSLRVVVVEDDADIREALCALVHMWGHEVAGVTGDGVSGVQLLLETKPDVGLIDVGLPGLSGYGVAEKVRSTLGPESPRLVAMTGFGQQSDVRRALEAGFDVHLVKPSTPDELRGAVEGAR